MTSALPSRRMQSAGTCWPASRHKTSSRTTSLTGISLSLPLRTTLTVEDKSTASLSICFFARISCTMPMRRFAEKMTTKRNCVMSARAKMSAAATSTHNRLKKVQILPMKMLAYDFEYRLLTSLNKNSLKRRSTCSSESPSSGAGEKRSASASEGSFLSFLNLRMSFCRCLLGAERRMPPRSKRWVKKERFLPFGRSSFAMGPPAGALFRRPA